MDVPACGRRRPATIGQFRPRNGRLLLAVDEGRAVGCGAVRVIAPSVAESSGCTCARGARARHRRGRCSRSCWQRPALGGREARLDTGWFMTDAHRLYRAAGFEERALYAGARSRPTSIRVEVHAARSHP